MNKKMVFTSACMLFTVSCTGLQTGANNTNTDSNNSVTSKNNSYDEIELATKRGENKSKTSNKNKKNNTKIKNTTEDDADYLNISFNSEELFNEKEMVDSGMPNSQLVLEKLKELKNEQKKILNNGSSKEKKVVELQNKLLKSYKHWKGTKYAMGGDSKNGIDCSAFTRRIYREVFSYELPRKTTQQIQVGQHIPKSKLKSGDIVFFTPDGSGSHTAVYLGNSLFLNASSSKGVVISTLENVYWNKNFKYGVRVDKMA